MSEASRERIRRDLLSRIPRWYSPALHLAIPAVTGIAIIAFALSRIEDLRAWQVAFVPVFLAFGNLVEWHAHRDLLHRRTWPLEVLYVRHTPQHHAIYLSDDMYIREFRELKFVLLPAYGVAAIAVVTSPITIALWAAGQRNLAALWLASVVFYLLTYEWLHLAYHLPAEGVVGGWRVTRWLRRHHQRHHAPELMQRWNFNVTVPLWDHVRGTVYRAPEDGAEGLLADDRRRPGAPTL
jgi:sterol desaturase/sphingolipid hydroxylase (fatty acid hydroxylase superfamily)